MTESENSNKDQLTAVSSVDGRYQDTTAVLAEYFSEYGLIHKRLLIECEYLIALSETPGVGMRELTDKEKKTLRQSSNISLEDAHIVKQIEKEGDTHAVGYGGMLLEGLVAVTALATVMMFAKGDPALGKGPTEIYAQGLAQFASTLGVPTSIAMSFGLLAFATFVYDTLDVATRLARYIFQELTGWQ